MGCTFKHRITHLSCEKWKLHIQQQQQQQQQQQEIIGNLCQWHQL